MIDPTTGIPTRYQPPDPMVDGDWVSDTTFLDPRVTTPGFPPVTDQGRRLALRRHPLVVLTQGDARLMVRASFSTRQVVLARPWPDQAAVIRTPPEDRHVAYLVGVAPVAGRPVFPDDGPIDWTARFTTYMIVATPSSDGLGDCVLMRIPGCLRINDHLDPGIDPGGTSVISRFIVRGPARFGYHRFTTAETDHGIIHSEWVRCRSRDVLAWWHDLRTDPDGCLRERTWT